jgi:hypothetical protein
MTKDVIRVYVPATSTGYIDQPRRRRIAPPTRQVEVWTRGWAPNVDITKKATTMTILEAAKTIMLANRRPMSSDEIYRAIKDQQLYEFHSVDPAGIVQRQVRRHCEGLSLATGAPTKHFRMVADGRYELLPASVSKPLG